MDTKKKKNLALNNVKSSVLHLINIPKKAGRYNQKWKEKPILKSRSRKYEMTELVDKHIKQLL